MEDGTGAIGKAVARAETLSKSAIEAAGITGIEISRAPSR